MGNPTSTRIRIPEAPACPSCRSLMKVKKTSKGYEGSCRGPNARRHKVQRIQLEVSK